MLFTAKIVEPNATGTMLITVSVIAMIFIAISLVVTTLEFLAPFFLITLLLFIITTAIITKGNMSSYKLENDLIVFDSEIQICNIVFPIEEIENLQFSFRSFNGMLNSIYRLETDPAQSRNYGLENEISFRYKQQSFTYKFFLQSQQHFHVFVQMLEELYICQTHFGEENNNGKTFLMQNVTDAQYQILINKYQRY